MVFLVGLDWAEARRETVREDDCAVDCLGVVAEYADCFAEVGLFVGGGWRAVVDGF